MVKNLGEKIWTLHDCPDFYVDNEGRKKSGWSINIKFISVEHFKT